MKLPPYNVFPTISDDKIALRQILPPGIQDLVEILFYDSIQATTTGQTVEMQDKINMDYQDSNSIHFSLEYAYWIILLATNQSGEIIFPK